MAARCWIGTSGWTYPSWRGVFYPENLPSRDCLAYYAREFSTTEVNYSFYHLPKPETYAKWAGQVPAGFLFSLKASRLITHTKRLAGVAEPWRLFVERARGLGAHLGPILLQFPPSLRKDRTRLERFLDVVAKDAKKQASLRLVFEFRHKSWFTEDVYRLLRRRGAALCIADSPRYPRKDVLTTDFAYLRFHGRTELFASKYSEAELREEARRVGGYLRKGMEVFVYFNNDAQGHAVANARTLRALINPTALPPPAQSSHQGQELRARSRDRRSEPAEAEGV